jgi:RNA:NAD 2'-phosphotransferase (TPT1/KptA family)
VTNSDKQRFELKTVGSTTYIRAAQGHSIKTISSEELLTPVTDASLYPHCVHGTNTKLWNVIKLQGLKKMGRKHVHFSSFPHGSKEVISGANINRHRAADYDYDDSDPFLCIDVDIWVQVCARTLIC